MINLLVMALAVVSFLSPATALAAGEISGGDTAWVLMATALVVLMAPAGLALFYGGQTRRKSTLNTIGMSYTAFCIGSLMWVLAGYSIAFGTANPFFGGWEHFLLSNIGVGDVTGSIPTSLFVCFQGAFAGVAVAIVAGSVVERVRYSTWIIFCGLWTLLCYAPIAHSVWGGGWLSEFGEIDFAGGTVVHINAGIAGLVCAAMLGRRQDMAPHDFRPSSVRLTLLGSALLWFGWFGFNAGSALAADAIAAHAFLVTNIAAASGGLGWLVTEWFTRNKRTLTGTAAGVICGLVAITPGAGFVGIVPSLIIGLLAGMIGYYAVVSLKAKLHFDDTLDTFGTHGLVGIFGTLATGIFAVEAVGGVNGLWYGNPGQVLSQLIAIVVVILYSAIATAISFQAASFITRGHRVSEEMETMGMDYAYHGEEGLDTSSEQSGSANK